nr:hypothetical protein [Tanacetum cinerariifolium]
MELCTTLQSRVLDLEKIKVTQANEIDSLNRRVKKLEKKQRTRTNKLKRLYKVGLTTRVESSDDNEDLGEDASKQGRISNIDTDKGITLVSTHDDKQIFDVAQDLGGEEVFVAQQDKNVVEKEVDAAQVQVTTAATTPTISIAKVTLAQALAELKHTKPKANAKRIVFHEPKESTTTTTIPKPNSQNKEPVKIKKKDQIMLDEEVALKLQAEFDKEQRLAREKAQKEDEEANIALIESWDDVQAKIDADYHLAERLKAEEQQELNDEERAKLFIAFKRVNAFVDFKTELVKESSKKAEVELMEQESTELEQKSSKKQKIDDDKETAKLK